MDSEEFQRFLDSFKRGMMLRASLQLADTTRLLNNHCSTYRRLQEEVQMHQGTLQDIAESSTCDSQPVAAITSCLEDIQARIEGIAPGIATDMMNARQLAEQVEPLNNMDAGSTSLGRHLSEFLDSLDHCRFLHHTTPDLLANAFASCSQVAATVLAGAEAAAQFDCPSCLDTKSIEDMFIVESCDHRCCRPCAEGWTRAELGDGRLPRCTQCQVPWHQADVRVLDQDLERRFIIVQMHQDVVANSLLKCPNRDCGVAVERPEQGQGTHFECLECGQDSCLACQVPWHEGSSCEAYQRCKAENDGFDDSAFKQWLRDNGGRVHKLSKGGCGHACLKDACNSVWCSVCGYYFCWFCLQKIADKGATHEQQHTHFGEPGPCYGKLFSRPNWDEDEYN